MDNDGAKDGVAEMGGHEFKIVKKGIDKAAALCEEKQCIAIGEIGRPHFPVDEQVKNDSNDILLYGMQKAEDVDVPVVLHTESTTPNQCKELVEMGKKVGLPALFPISILFTTQRPPSKSSRPL